MVNSFSKAVSGGSGGAGFLGAYPKGLANTSIDNFVKPSYGDFNTRQNALDPTTGGWPNKRRDLKTGQIQNVSTQEEISQAFAGTNQTQRAQPLDASIAVEHFDFPDAFETDQGILNQIMLAQFKNSNRWILNYALPWKFSANLSYNWKVYHYHPTFLAVVPEEGVSHLATSSQQIRSIFMKRYGHSVQNERGFAHTKSGVIDGWCKVQQIKEGALQTAAFNAMTALMEQPDFEETDQQVYNIDDVDTQTNNSIYARCATYLTMWDILKKDPVNGIRDLEANATRAVEANDGFVDSVIFPQGTESAISEALRGTTTMNFADSITMAKTLKAGMKFPDGTTKLAFQSFNIRMGHLQQSYDAVFRRRSIGNFWCHYLNAKTCNPSDYTTSKRGAYLHDMQSDDMKVVGYKEVMKYLGYWQGWDEVDYTSSENHGRLSKIGQQMFHGSGVRTYKELLVRSGQLEYFKEVLLNKPDKVRRSILKDWKEMFQNLPYRPGADTERFGGDVDMTTTAEDEYNNTTAKNNARVVNTIRFASTPVGGKAKHQNHSESSSSYVSTDEDSEEDDMDMDMERGKKKKKHYPKERTNRHREQYKQIDDELRDYITSHEGDVNDPEYDIFINTAMSYQHDYPDSQILSNVLQAYKNYVEKQGRLPGKGIGYIGWSGISNWWIHDNLSRCLRICERANQDQQCMLFPLESQQQKSNQGLISSINTDQMIALDSANTSSLRWNVGGGGSDPSMMTSKQPKLYLNPYMLQPVALDFSSNVFTIAQKRLAFYELDGEDRAKAVLLSGSPVLVNGGGGPIMITKNKARIATFMYCYATSLAYSFVDDYFTAVKTATDLIQTEQSSKRTAAKVLTKEAKQRERAIARTEDDQDQVMQEQQQIEESTASSINQIASSAKSSFNIEGAINNLLHNLRKCIVPLALPGQNDSVEYLQYAIQSINYPLLECQAALSTIFSQSQELVRLLYKEKQSGQSIDNDVILQQVKRIEVQNNVMLHTPVGSRTKRRIGSSQTGGRYTHRSLGPPTFVGHALNNSKDDIDSFDPLTSEQLNEARDAVNELHQSQLNLHGIVDITTVDGLDSFQIFDHDYVKLYISHVYDNSNKVKSNDRATQWKALVIFCDNIGRLPRSDLLINKKGKPITYDRSQIISRILYTVAHDDSAWEPFDTDQKAQDLLKEVKADATETLKSYFQRDVSAYTELAISQKRASFRKHAMNASSHSIPANVTGSASSGGVAGGGGSGTPTGIIDEPGYPIVELKQFINAIDSKSLFGNISPLEKEVVVAYLFQLAESYKIATKKSEVFRTAPHLLSKGSKPLKALFAFLTFSSNPASVNALISDATTQLRTAFIPHAIQELYGPNNTARTTFFADANVAALSVQVADSIPLIQAIEKFHKGKITVDELPDAPDLLDNQAHTEEEQDVMDAINMAEQTLIDDPRLIQLWIDRDLPTGIAPTCMMPHMIYWMGTVIYFAGRGRTGNTLYKELDWLMNEIAATHMQESSMICYMTAVITETKNRLRVPNVYCKGYDGGADILEFWDPLNETHRQMYNTQGRKTYRSVFVIGRFENDDCSDAPVLTLPGTWGSCWNASDKEQLESDYPTKDILSQAYWNWEIDDHTDLRSINATIDPYNGLQQQQHNRANHMCFRKLHFVYQTGFANMNIPDVERVLSKKVSGKGHFGNDEGPGVGLSRRGYTNKRYVFPWSTDGLTSFGPNMMR